MIGYTHMYQDAVLQGMSTHVFERGLFLLKDKTQLSQEVTLEEELEM